MTPVPASRARLAGPVLAAALAGAAVGLWTPWSAPVVATARADTPKRAPRPVAAARGGITGVVRYRGEPPARAPLDRGTDPVCAGEPRLSEKIVVADGKLRDVHVRVAVGAAGEHAPPAEPVVVDQRECMYVPRVVGVMAGQKLVVRNSDPTYHNVRGTVHEHTEWNLGQPPQAPPITREALGKPGEVVTLRCDIHPWMRAYAVVSDHPYFDVTGDDGAFSLEGVPPGRYTVEAWHPELGTKRAEVTVAPGKAGKPGKPVKIDFAFP